MDVPPTPTRVPRTGSCLTRGKELSEETHADKARDFIGRRHLGGEQQGKGIQENCSVTCHVARSLGFYGDGISFQVVFGQSFWLRVLPGGTRIAQPRWMLARGIREVDGHVVSPFDLSWTLLVGGGQLVPCSLPGPPVVKQLMQMVTREPGQGGRFQSVCFS